MSEHLCCELVNDDDPSLAKHILVNPLQQSQGESPTFYLAFWEFISGTEMQMCVIM